MQSWMLRPVGAPAPVLQQRRCIGYYALPVSLTLEGLHQQKKGSCIFIVNVPLY